MGLKTGGKKTGGEGDCQVLCIPGQADDGCGVLPIIFLGRCPSETAAGSDG